VVDPRGGQATAVGVDDSRRGRRAASERRSGGVGLGGTFVGARAEAGFGAARNVRWARRAEVHVVLATGLFQRFKDEMRIRRYSPRTIKSYVIQLRAFVRFLHPRIPRDAQAQDIRAFMLHSLDTGLSRASLDHAVSALKFLFVELYGWDNAEFDVPRPKREQALPEVPTREEVLALGEALENRRHRLAVLLMYGSGVRVGELVQLRVADVDVKELTLRVKGGKGRKDRMTVLPEALVPELRALVQDREPEELLMRARHGGHWTVRSVERVLQRACEKAGIRKRITPHSLRHAFATHVLEAGTEIGLIQALLGHSRVQTTRRYTRVRNPRKMRVRSPL
jgi:site-specific recombinase XerD